MTVEEILLSLPAQDGGLTIQYNGKTYPMPYQELEFRPPHFAVRFNGLRECQDRAKRFQVMMGEYGVNFRDGSYLDLGSNLGYFPYFFSAVFKKSFGIEKESRYVDIARRLYPEVNYQQQDFNQSIFLPSGTFEVITSLSMLEYITDKKGFLHEIYRHTGKLFILEGHSESVKKGEDKEFEALLLEGPWGHIERMSWTTEPGRNAPKDSPGRPVWACLR